MIKSARTGSLYSLCEISSVLHLLRSAASMRRCERGFRLTAKRPFVHSFVLAGVAVGCWQSFDVP